MPARRVIAKITAKGVIGDGHLGPTIAPTSGARASIVSHLTAAWRLPERRCT
jgi:hypothetical protein